MSQNSGEPSERDFRRRRTTRPQWPRADDESEDADDDGRGSDHAMTRTT